MNVSKIILLLGAGHFQVPGIQRAKRLGYEVVAVDQDAEAPGLDIADHGYATDLADVDRCLEIARKHAVDGVTTVAVEAAVEPMAKIAEELGLPGPTPEAAQAASNKHIMRQRFEVAGVPSTAWRAVQTAREARRAAEEIGYPVIVKPPDSSGSRGVQMVEEEARLGAAFEGAWDTTERGEVLLEGFLDGPEVSLEGFVIDGTLQVLALSEKTRTDPPYLLDETVAFPSNLEEATRFSVIEITRHAIQALNLDTVAVHAELILTTSGPRMVELAARGPGFQVFTRMIPTVTGCDTIATLLDLATGGAPTLKSPQRRGCILHFPHFGTGRIKNVRGLEAARKIDGVLEVEIYKSPGEEIPTLTCGADRPGHIVTTAETRHGAEEVLHQALSRIDVQLE